MFLRFLIFGLLIATSLAADARRRSRIDAPVKVPSVEPLEDSLATASESDAILEKFEKLPTIAVEEPKKEETKELKKEEEEVTAKTDECNSDNISFELVTG